MEKKREEKGRQSTENGIKQVNSRPKVRKVFFRENNSKLGINFLARKR